MARPLDQWTPRRPRPESNLVDSGQTDTEGRTKKESPKDIDIGVKGPRGKDPVQGGGVCLKVRLGVDSSGEGSRSCRSPKTVGAPSDPGRLRVTGVTPPPSVEW